MQPPLRQTPLEETTFRQFVLHKQSKGSTRSYIFQRTVSQDVT